MHWSSKSCRHSRAVQLGVWPDFNHPAPVHLWPNAQHVRHWQAAAVNVSAEEHVWVSPQHFVQLHACSQGRGGNAATELPPPLLIRWQRSLDLQ